jgi:hypothetical protein
LWLGLGLWLRDRLTLWLGLGLWLKLRASWHHLFFRHRLRTITNASCLILKLQGADWRFDTAQASDSLTNSMTPQPEQREYRDGPDERLYVLENQLSDLHTRIVPPSSGRAPDDQPHQSGNTPT